jgi:microcystin-dependent protein
MSNPFVAEIRIFCGNFAPKGWAFCNGQILPISQNTALFSLLGTTYGGDGKSNFALPNLQGSFPMHPGAGPGLTLRDLGESGGTGTVTLIASEMPTHAHAPFASGDAATSASPVPGVASPVMLAATSVPVYGALTEPTSLDGAAIGPAGGNQPHENHQPYLALNFIIALQGVFPPRS